MQFLGFLWAIPTYILRALKLIFGLATTRFPTWVYRLCVVLLWLSLSVVLGFFSDEILSWFEADHPNRLDFLPARVNDFIQDFWCGIMFFLFWPVVGLLIYCFIQLFEQTVESEFGDIDRAWQAGLKGLADQGLDLQKTPLFLVVGVHERDEAAFFMAAKFGWNVVAPAFDQTNSFAPINSPLRFYANHDAVFVTCSGVSTTCAQLALLPEVLIDRSATMPPAAIRGLDTDQTMRPGAVSAAAEPDFLGTMQPGYMNTLKPGGIPASSPVRSISPASARALGTKELWVCERRIRHLSGLITRDRAPQCPLNGLLITVPLDWARDDADRNYQISLQQDVEVLHDGLQQLFPIVCVLTGLQRLGDVNELVERVRKVNSRFGSDGRAGSSYPMGMFVDDSSAPWLVDRGLEWFRDWIYKAFANDLNNPTNVQLYRLMCNLDERRAGLVELLQGVFGETMMNEKIRLSGCYYCAVDSRRRQSTFVRGIFTKLLDEQDAVAYPRHLRQRDKRSQKFLVPMVVLLLLVCLADLFYLYKLYGAWK